MATAQRSARTLLSRSGPVSVARQLHLRFYAARSPKKPPIATEKQPLRFKVGNALVHERKPDDWHLEPDVKTVLTEPPEGMPPNTIQHGQQIFAYTNIDNGQVIYATGRVMKERSVLKQLPFLGKSLQPAFLRKDKWLPYFMTYFPSAFAGLEAYQKLIEYKTHHERAWRNDQRLIASDNNHYYPAPLRHTPKIALDQRANSVADLSMILMRMEKGPRDRQVRAARKREKKYYRTQGRVDGAAPYRGAGDLAKALSLEGVVISWVDLRNAEYAREWPAAVAHAQLEAHRYQAACPAAVHMIGKSREDEVEEGDGEAEEVGEAKEQASQ